MNETLYYEPVFESTVDAQVAEFDSQIPEYINPDWDDDALYNLICANQDVLVDINGNTMTLSAAMNEHPGPWTAENEANLIAYAEALLASTPIEPAVPEEQKPEEIENEQTLDLHQREDSPVQEVVQQVQAENKPERPDRQKEKTTPLPLETPSVPSKPTISVHTDAAVRDDKGIVNNPDERVAIPETLNRGIELENRTGRVEQVLETVRSIEARETQAREASQSEPQTPLEMPEAPDVVYAENSTVVDAVEPDNVSEPTDEVVGDEAVGPQVFENEYEPLYGLSELTVDEIPIDSPPDYVPDTATADQVEVTESNQFEPISVIAEEVESTFMQLAELIESNAPEDNEEIDIIMNKILEAPARLEIETKEEWEKLYAELFEAAGITYSLELVESLSSLTIKWNLIDEIEGLKDTDDAPEDEDRSARMMVRKLLVAITNIIQTIRHIFTIGTYALRLSLAPRVGYR